MNDSIFCFFFFFPRTRRDILFVLRCTCFMDKIAVQWIRSEFIYFLLAGDFKLNLYPDLKNISYYCNWKREKKLWINESFKREIFFNYFMKCMKTINLHWKVFATLFSSGTYWKRKTKKKTDIISKGKY